MILRSVGHRRGDRRGPRGRRRRSRCCRRSSRSSGRGSTRSPCAGSRSQPGADGPWARLARRVMRHPVAVLVPTLSLLLLLGAAVPARPVQRPGRDDPAAVGPVARGLRHPRPRVRRGRVRAARARGPDDRRRDDARRTSRSCTTTRDASRPTRGSAASSSLVDVDPRLTLAQYQLLYAAPGGPPDRFVATALAATTKGDLTAFTVYTPLRPEPRRGPGARPRAPRPGRPARAARRRLGARRRRRRGRRRRRVARLVGLPADRRCSSSSRRSSCCSSCSGRSSCRSRRWS